MLPETAGNAGEVLTYPASGNELQWGTATGGANKIDDLSDALLNTSKNNLFLGHNASNISALNDYNVAVGITALDAVTTGNKNTAMGHESLSSNTSGESNTAIGAEALNQNVTGNWNTASGYQSLFQSTGDNNVAFGFQAGKNLTSGQNNVFIGYDADAGTTTTSSTNSIVIGAGAVGAGDNSVVIGNDNIESTFFKGNAYFKPGRNVSVTTFNGAGGSLTVGGQVTVSGNSELRGGFTIGSTASGSNYYSFPTSRGTDGQVLSMSSTPGQLEWTSPSQGSNSPWSTSSGNIYRSSGYVGIGTSTPSYPLDVYGDGQIYGNIGIGIPPDQSAFNPYKLKVNGPTRVNGDIDIIGYGNLNVGGNTSVAGTATIAGPTTISGTTTIASNVKVGGSTANSKAVLDIESTSKGVLVPRMTSSQRLSINPSSTEDGLLVYQTNTGSNGDAKGFYYYKDNGTNPPSGSWISLNNSGSSNLLWSGSDTDGDGNIDGIETSTNSYNVGIGTYPSSVFKLNVDGSTAIEGDLYINDDGSGYSGNLNMNGDAMITGGNITVQKDYNNNGGNITADGDITFSLDTVSNNATSPVAMVVSNNSGSLKLMDMSNMGSHWSSDASGNPYVENKRVGIGTNTPNTQSMLEVVNTVSGITNTNYAGKFKSENGFRNYAISAEATKSGATWNFGLYAKAENATYNYAAYFPKGDVRIYDKLELGVSSNYGEFVYVDGTQGSGKVLTSDANGNASWNDIIYPWTVNPSGHAYRNSNIGIGDFTQSGPSFPLHITSSTNERGIQTEVSNINSTQSKIGIVGIIQNSSGGNGFTGQNIGGHFGSYNNSGGNSYAFEAIASNNTGTQYGIVTTATGNSSTINYGISSLVSSTSSSATNYGLYSSATGGSTNWAGYFASGNVKIENNLEIDGNIKITGSTHSNGAVLTSDGNGNATWQQPVGSGSSGGSNSKTFNYLSDGF